jgi:hypothetical protein
MFHLYQSPGRKDHSCFSNELVNLIVRIDIPELPAGAVSRSKPVLSSLHQNRLQLVWFGTVDRCRLEQDFVESNHGCAL